MVAHAHANAEFARFDADWYGTDDPIATAPWLFDAGGNPIEVPADALGFRARYLPPGSRGMGELVIDEAGGMPLFVPRGCGPEEFCALVLYRPGRYRLALIDERYQFLRHAPVACFLITPAMAAAHHASAPAVAAAAAQAPHADPLVLQLVEVLRAQTQAQSHADPLVLHLVEALRGALTETRGALTETLSVIRAQNADGGRNLSELVRASATVVTAADGAGISRRDPLPMPPPMVVDASAIGVGEDSGGPPNLGDVLGGALSNLAPVMQHFMNTKIFKMSEETSLAMLKAMQGASGMQAAPANSPSPAGAINPATLWPHVAAIEQLLSSDEAAVVRRYLSNAGGEQVAQLAREVMARSAPDAAAWIRALLADVERTQSPHQTTEAAGPAMDPQRPPGEHR